MLAFQPSLFDRDHIAFDATLSRCERIHLDESSWVDHATGWVRGSDRLFLEILESRTWGQRTRWMYDHRVREPRLTGWWEVASGTPLEPRVLEDLRRCLSAHYGVVFDSAGFNLYRDGRDSVAWHGDKFEKELAEPI